MAVFRHVPQRVGVLGELALLDNFPKQRKIPTRRDPFDEESEEEFIEHYRLSKQVALTLLAKIEHLLPSSQSRRGCPIPPRLQFLVALRYFASGDLQQSTGDCSNLSQQAVSKCVKTVSHAIAELAVEYIKFPHPTEENKTMQQFLDMTGLPEVLGCVDGILIPIISPGGPQAESYYCRKGFFALNVMVVCDASMLFTNVVVNWPGSTDDSSIFQQSNLHKLLKNGEYKGYLVGDTGYACSPHLISPLRYPGTEKEHRFNMTHAQALNIVHKAVGLLKQRFAVLNHRMRTQLATTEKIITACAVLHNICQLHHILVVPECDVPVEVEEVDEDGDDYVGRRGARRASVVKTYF